jgi:hypothetical protein
VTPSPGGRGESRETELALRANESGNYNFKFKLNLNLKPGGPARIRRPERGRGGVFILILSLGVSLNPSLSTSFSFSSKYFVSSRIMWCPLSRRKLTAARYISESVICFLWSLYSTSLRSLSLASRWRSGRVYFSGMGVLSCCGGSGSVSGKPGVIGVPPWSRLTEMSSRRFKV